MRWSTLPGSRARPSLQLRAPSAQQAGPVFEHHDAAGWHHQTRTTRTGLDLYQTDIDALGDWALARLDRSPANGSGLDVGLLAGGIAVLVLTGALIGLRLTRRAPSP